MATVIYNNIPSVTSQRYLGISNSNLAKSLERLSSGLRINHASDDASGLAISEKLRGQISGLKRASMNAQDGISMLQTAEGAMGEVQNILQRMRELAVQASNGIYTTNDRKYIQDEVDQLKAEVNRISTSTEFNTKKLLNGDATALWSTDKGDKLSAIIRSRVAEGNYNINAELKIAGQNYVYKSDVMTLNEGALGAQIDTSIGTAADTNDTNVAYVKDPISMPATGTSYFTVTIGSTSAVNTDSALLTGVYQQSGSSWSVALGTTVSASFSGYVEVEFLTNYTGTATTDGFRYRTIDASTGAVGSWTTGDLSGNGIDASAIGSIVSADITVSSGQQVTAGDKILIAVSDNDTVTNNATVSGGGSIRISDGPSGFTGPRIEYASGQLTLQDNGDSTVDYNDVTVYYAELDQSTGNLNLGNITLGFKEQSYSSTATYAPTDTGDFRMTINGGGDVATTTTKLKDIARFVDADGNNLFDNKQELTIWGNGTSAVIYLEADDTISDFETKLTEAIVHKLGLGSSNTQVNNHLVDYVSIAGSDNYAVKGTFVIQTALAGEQGEIAFSGDQRLIDAMSLAEIQKAVGNTTTITIKDAHTGDLVGLDETGNDRVSGIIQGIEVLVDSRANVSASWDGNSIVFSPNSTNDSYFLHVVDNSTDLQIGPNQGQTLSVSIPQLDVKGLGIDNVHLVSQKLAQRAIPDIDNALSQVVTIRATIGAQINRLEHTVANLSVAHENMTASESRIRDLDVAEEMSMFTRSQILSQAGTAMLAQANQIPQMALQLLQG